MNKIITFLSVCAFAGAVFAQVPQWQWAKSGGDSNHSTDSNPDALTKEMEQIKDIAVDNNNNIYFATLIGGNVNQPPTFMGVSIPVYNQVLTTQALTDVLIGKMDCNGNLLWHYIIGSAQGEYLSGFGIDTLGGVYVSVKKYWGTDALHCGNPNSEDTAIVPQVLNFLVKLDTAGNFQWVHYSPYEERLYLPIGLAVEKDGTLHWLISALDDEYGDGSYYLTTIENGQIVMDDAFLEQQDMVVARYDKDGNYLNYVPLPIKNAARNYYYSDNNVEFRYEPVYQRYYLGGYLVFAPTPASGTTTEAWYHVIIAGDTVWHFASDSEGHPDYENTGESYIAAFDYTGNHLWHYKGKAGWVRSFIENHQTSEPNLSIGHNISSVNSLEADNIGNVYLYSWTKDFGPLVSDSLYQRVIKISPNGNMIWSDIVPNEIFLREKGKVGVNNKSVVLMTNKRYLYINNLWQDCSMSSVSQLRWKEFDKNTLQQTAQYEWTSDLNITAIGKAQRNQPTIITTDKFGNFIVGGAVGTRFYLNNNDSSVMIYNNGFYDTDFWIGKFGSINCQGDEIPNSAVPQINTSSGIKIYPNPVNYELKITNYGLGNNDYTVFSISGQVVMKGKLETSFNSPSGGNPSGATTINVSSLAQDVYFIKIGNTTGKFVKK